MKLVPCLVPLAAAFACGGNPAPATDAPRTTGDPDAAAPTDGTIDARDPATDGTFDVTESTVAIPGATQGRSLPSTVFAPTTGSGRALAIVSPGFQMSREQYRSYARHLATWGVVAVLTDYAETGFFLDHEALAADVPAVIDWALAQPALAIDGTKIAALGHSLGGKISVLAASGDPRIRAVVGWDPVDSSDPSVAPEKLTGLTAAVAVVGETTNASGGGMPCAPAAENFLQFYAAAPSPALAITVAQADHMDWVDDRSCGFCGFCRDGTADDEVARTVSRRVDVAWLRRHLFGDVTMDAWLASPPELATGAVQIQQR